MSSAAAGRAAAGIGFSLSALTGVLATEKAHSTGSGRFPPRNRLAQAVPTARPRGVPNRTRTPFRHTVRVSELDRLAKRYRAHHESSRGRELVWGGTEGARLFARLVGGPGRRVLDLGCRYGALTAAYAAGNDVVGVDADRAALAEASAALGIATQWADVEQSLDFPDASFDVVVAGELLEHLREPDTLVAEVYRLLRRGGRFVGSV